jgi:V/A-type H+-transporting ATPase subunit I
MALAAMQKVMIVAHRSQATELLGVLQDAGLVQILDAERAMVTKEWPELVVESKRHRSIAETTDRLSKAIDFLKPYSEKDATSLFAPFVQVDEVTYSNIVSQKDSLSYLGQVEEVATQLEKLAMESENLTTQQIKLAPWQTLTVPVEQLGGFATSTLFIGQVGDQHFDSLCEKLAEFQAAVEIVAQSNRMQACIVVCLNEVAGDVQKALRSAEFEAAGFEGVSGTIDENIRRIQNRLGGIETEKKTRVNRAVELAKDKLNMQILFDHLQNLHGRLAARSAAPATDHAIFLEGWVKKKQFAHLERLVTQFNACDVAAIEAAADEEPPVEIENGPMTSPFEAVTRLYGMPAISDVDPTVFLAPFFALFFGICLTDAAYGLVMIGFLWWLLRKIRGDKKFVMMMIFCSITTVVAGALTGGWCGDTIQQFIPQLAGFRNALMWFDPLEKPMYFFNISLGLGYLQIVTGILVGCIHKFRRGEKTAAIFDHLSWFIWLNSLAVFGLAKAGLFGERFAWLGTVAGVAAIIPALMIILFSEREGGWGARIGMGLYNVFSTVFYVGDVLSYIRLMALGMVTAGFGMAINEIVKSVMEMGIFGYILGALIFVGGHVFNIANSALSAFVHSMRLQFVEFFTKFLQGGGKEFDPLRESYRYIEVKKEKP